MRTLRRLVRASLVVTAPLALGLVAPAAAQPAAPAAAEPPRAPDVVANNWLRLGLERYEHGNLVGAIEAFEQGYAVEPRPEFLFALGQAHRRRGDCDRADRYFGEFLATGPSAGQAEAARAQLTRCEPAPPPPPAPVAVAAPAPPPPAVIGAPSPRRDRIAWIVGGGGVALAATGAALVWLAHDRAADADAATTYDRHHALAARARTFEVGGAIALSAAAVAGGVVAWRVMRGGDERAPAVRVTLASHGYGLAVRGAF